VGSPHAAAARKRAVRETLAVLEAAAKAWAKSSCPGSAECCHLAVTTRPPWLWPTEWAVVEQALMAGGRSVPPPRSDQGCRLLDAAGQRCTIYESRPFGCRTFFCARRTGPKEPAAQTNALLEQLAALNIALDAGAAPRTLDDWLSASARSPEAP
jgi:Fe-S-cluster containining protein